MVLGAKCCENDAISVFLQRETTNFWVKGNKSAWKSVWTQLSFLKIEIFLSENWKIMYICVWELKINFKKNKTIFLWELRKYSYISLKPEKILIVSNENWNSMKKKQKTKTYVHKLTEVYSLHGYLHAHRHKAWSSNHLSWW